MDKQCNTCKETKPLSEFNKQKGGRLGVRATCRVCQKEKDRLYREKNRDKIREREKEKYREDIEKSREQARIRAKEHYYKTIDKQRQIAKDKYHSLTEEEREEYNKYKREWYHKNKEVINEKRREQYKNDPSLREKHSQWSKAYYQDNREDLIQNAVEYKRNRRQNDIVYKLRHVVSNAVWYAVTGQRGSKGGKTFDELPYTPHDLKEHLENQFDDNMTWENYGSYWHIDHIYPHSKLPYDSLKHPNFQKAWALSNLRPLEAKENQSKGDKILTEDKE